MKFVKVNIYSTLENCSTMEVRQIKEEAYINLDNIKYVLVFGDTVRVCFSQEDYLEIDNKEWLTAIGSK